MTIAGLARWPAWVERGDVRIDGRVVIEAGVQDGRRDLGIGFVPQFAMNGLNPSYTIFRQVTEAAELTMDAPEARRRATHLLERVGLEVGRHRAFPHQLSGGMRQRVVIAMALVNRPSLIVADEPLSGLDVTTQVSVLQLFRELRDEFGVAILLISHDLASVKDASDEMVVMYAGRVVEIAPSCGVGGSQSHPYSQALVSAFPDIDSDRSILRAIAGDAPDLSRLPPGCAFYPRCVEAEARCCESVPPLVQGAHSAVACLRRVPT